MTETTVATPELSEKLAKASWRDVGSPDDDYKLERTDLEGSEGSLIYMRKKGTPTQIYVTQAKDTSTWHCLKCRTKVLAAQVAHPIHNGPFPLSGSGQCSNETVPYCPTCEKKPNFHGSAISG